MLLGILALNSNSYGQELKELNVQDVGVQDIVDMLQSKGAGTPLKAEYLKRLKQQLGIKIQHSGSNRNISGLETQSRSANKEFDDSRHHIPELQLGPFSGSKPPFQFSKAGATVASTQVTILDSLALVALYESANGGNWNNKTNWLVEGKPVGEWDGVNVEDGRVTRLILTGNNLSGSIPPEIGDLTALRVLYLYRNDLSGGIPTEIGNLTNLEALNLYDTQLTGEIPTEIGNLTNLNHLYLHNNQLSGEIPSKLGNLSNLETLSLSGNQLSGSIPSEILNLNNLKRLLLGNNDLSGLIPSSIGELPSLVDLWLHSNQFSGGIPLEIGNILTLEDLSLFGNNLGGPVPTSVLNLENLTYLNVSNNELVDLPNLSPLTALVALSIQENAFTFEDIESNVGVASNSFTYAPQDSFGTAQLIELSSGDGTTLFFPMGGADFNEYQWYKDEIPITGATNATYEISSAESSHNGEYILKVTNTKATDLTLTSRPITVTVNGLNGLQVDSLALKALYESTDGDNWGNNANWLDEPVSEWHGVTVNDSRVTGLDLSGNNLDGTIPADLGNLTSLQSLNLGENNLTGQIPSELGQLSNLVQLWLYDNDLSGDIPPELGNLNNLMVLYLQNNSLSGVIPPQVGNMESLFILSLAVNQFSGEIPSELGQLTNLIQLWLYDNDLSGEIPPELGNLSNLNFLIARNNQFTGEIPSELSNSNGLGYLDLQKNQLTGEIPAEFGDMSSLYRVWLNDNNLTGSIPKELENLLALQDLYLGNNELTGEIPSELGPESTSDEMYLYNLENLYLSDNNLSGKIPQTLGTLPNLASFHAGNNQLEGAVPAAWGNSDSLFTLELNDNELDSLPDFSGADSLNRLLVDSLKLTFDDIIPNLGLELDSLVYSPQKPFGEQETISVSIGRSAELEPKTTHPDNAYQWYFDGEPIDGATSKTLNIESITESDFGSYHVEVTNSNVADMTLRSESILLEPVQRELIVDYNTGWQLVSSPVEGSIDVKNYFSTADTALYAYNGSYEIVSSLTQGTGYWLKFSESGPGSFNGNASLDLDIQLEEGWNLIGTGTDSASYSAIDDPDGILIDETLKAYNGAYTNPDKLAPGRGYWVLSSGAGTITLNMDVQSSDKTKPSSVVKNFDQLKISNGRAEQSLYLNGELKKGFTLKNFSLPPVPPAPQLDSRFEGDYRLATADSATISLTSAVYPVSINFKAGLSPSAYIIAGVTNGKLKSKQVLNPGQTVKLNQAYEKVAVWKKTGSTQDLPEEFELGQNYPNPFNPTTTIHYELPVQAEVSMVIYDMLGRKVATLVDAEKDPGAYSTTFDGSSLASGIYILRMQAGSFEKVQKLTLIK